MEITAVVNWKRNWCEHADRGSRSSTHKEGESISPTGKKHYKKPKQKVSIRAREKSDILALLVPKKIKLSGEGLIK